jgi:hypothetical protein
MMIKFQKDAEASLNFLEILTQLSAPSPQNE